MGGVVNAIGSVAKVIAAPITAPIAAVQSIVAGDNVLNAAKNATLQVGAALNPLATIEAAAGVSPLGFGAVAQGSTEASDQNRFLLSSAIGATAGLGAAALGGAAAAGGVAAATTGGAAATGGLSAGTIAATAGAVGTAAKTAGSIFGSDAPDNAVTPMPSATRTLASNESEGISQTTLLVAGGFLLAILILNRKG